MNNNNNSSSYSKINLYSILVVEISVIIIIYKFIKYYNFGRNYYIYPLLIGLIIAAINQIQLFIELLTCNKLKESDDIEKITFKNISKILEYKIDITEIKLKRLYYIKLLNFIKNQALWGGLFSISFFMSSAGIYSTLTFLLGEREALIIIGFLQLLLIIFLIISIGKYKKTYSKKEELKSEINLEIIKYAYNYFEKYIYKRDEICFICRHFSDKDEFFKDVKNNSFHNYYKVKIHQIENFYKDGVYLFDFLEFNAVSLCNYCMGYFYGLISIYDTKKTLKFSKRNNELFKKMFERYYGKELWERMEEVSKKINNDKNYEVKPIYYKQIGDYYKFLLDGEKVQKPDKLKELEHLIWDPIFEKYNLNV